MTAAVWDIKYSFFSRVSNTAGEESSLCFNARGFSEVIIPNGKFRDRNHTIIGRLGMKIATELLQTNHAADNVSVSLILPHTCMLLLLISSLWVFPKTTLHNFWLQTFINSRHGKREKPNSGLVWWSSRSEWEGDGCFNRSTADRWLVVAQVFSHWQFLEAKQQKQMWWVSKEKTFDSTIFKAIFWIPQSSLQYFTAPFTPSASSLPTKIYSI